MGEAYLTAEARGAHRSIPPVRRRPQMRQVGGPSCRRFPERRFGKGWRRETCLERTRPNPIIEVVHSRTIDGFQQERSRSVRACSTALILARRLFAAKCLTTTYRPPKATAASLVLSHPLMGPPPMNPGTVFIGLLCRRRPSQGPTLGPWRSSASLCPWTGLQRTTPKLRKSTP